MLKKLRVIAVLAVIILAFPALALAATVSLAWDASASISVTGYKVYTSTTSGVYGTGIDVGKVLTYTVPGLAEGTNYYFVATAYNPGAESSYSNEVSTTTPWGKPLPPSMKPVVGSIAALNAAEQNLSEYLSANLTAGFPEVPVGQQYLRLASRNLTTAREELKAILTSLK
jgi:hypothetical protein